MYFYYRVEPSIMEISVHLHLLLLLSTYAFCSRGNSVWLCIRFVSLFFVQEFKMAYIAFSYFSPTTTILWVVRGKRMWLAKHINMSFYDWDEMRYYVTSPITMPSQFTHCPSKVTSLRLLVEPLLIQQWRFPLQKPYLFFRCHSNHTEEVA